MTGTLSSLVFNLCRELNNFLAKGAGTHTRGESGRTAMGFKTSLLISRVTDMLKRDMTALVGKESKRRTEGGQLSDKV